MTPERLLASLEARGVILTRKGDRLRVRVPEAVASPSLETLIRQHKLTLVDGLRAREAAVHVYGFDTETVAGEPITVQWAGPEGAALVRVTRESALPTLLAFLRTHGAPQETNLAWAHNLSFDLGVCTLQHPDAWCAAQRSSRQRILANNAVLDLSFYDGDLLFAEVNVGDRCWRLLDTMAFFKTSLDTVCERLKLPVRKLPRPSYLGQRLPTNAEWPAFEQYAATDALAAYHLGRFLVEAHREFGMHEPTISVAKMASEVFAVRHLRGSTIPSGAAEPDFLTASRAAYHGGKNGIVEPGVYEDVAEVDITSAYPHAMASLPPLTRGHWDRVCAYVPGAAAIYHVKGTVDGRCPYGVFLRRQGKDSIAIWEGDFDLWTTGYELASPKGEIRAEILHGYVWVPEAGATNPFQAYVHEFFTRKQRVERTDPMREVYKLLLNALYGKLVQPGGALYSPFWAAQITGHCRARLHGLEHQYQALHSSTDSILTQATDIPTGSGLGDLDVRARGTLVLVRNKLYVLLGPDGRILKSTLHGFQGSAERLLEMLRHGERTYAITHMIKPREAAKSKSGLRPFQFIEKTMHLNLPEKTWAALAAGLAQIPETQA